MTTTPVGFAPPLPLPRRQNCAHAQFRQPFTCVASTSEPAVPVLLPRPRPRSSVRRVGTGSSILLQTEHYVAVDKPAGLLVHRTKLDRTARESRYVVNELRATLSGPNGGPTEVFPVHRLDRCTSGVMLFALHTSENAARLQAALQRPDTNKYYWALAAGSEMPATWTNDHPLKDLSGNNRLQRSARTEFEQLLWLPEAEVSVVRALLRSGRRHQIRRHLSNSRFPILGDSNYARGKLNRFVREKYSVTRCCLHSRRLTFSDPFDDRRVTIEAPVPDDLRVVLNRLPGYDPSLHDKDVDLGSR